MERKYKDSGIEWIGKIPETWEVTKLLNVLKSPISDGPHETPSLVENGIPFISVDSLNDSDKVDLSVVRKFISYQDFQEYSKKSKIEKGDILFSKAATIGKTAIVGDETFMVWSPLAIIKTNNNRVNNKFIYHVLNCHRLILYISFLGTYNTQINVGMRALERAIIPLPPLSNQHRIADYLDEKCVEIDSLIALQEQMIEKLKAYKQSVITEAVTKGLDPNAKLVPSGIDWIGEIPEGWKLPKTLYTLEMPITDGPHTTPELYESGIPFVSAEAVSCGNGGIDFDHIRGFISQEFYEECCLKYIPQIGDVYMIKSGATTGKVSIVDTDKVFTIWSPLAVFRSNRNIIIPRFLLYTLQGDYFQKQISLHWTFGTQQNIGMRTLEQLLIVLPPLSEQQAIAAYLDEKCADIDRLIALKQQKVESLKDYKKSVIYEAVTGKTEI